MILQSGIVTDGESHREWRARATLSRRGAIKADFGSARFRNTILISMGANSTLDTYALLETLNVGTGAN